MLPSVPIFPVYNFFRQNIWHSIFDQFHFHHIFGDEMSIIRQDRQQAKALVVHFGDQLNVLSERRTNIWRQSRWVNKYLYFSNLNFTMKGATVKKAILRFFSHRDLICHHQKFQPWQTPPSRFLPRSPRFLTNIRCRYFSLNIWVVYDQLELDWCIFDQNWAKSRPLHFQIFQILNAIDRRIVHCIGHPARQLKLDKHRRTINISKDFRTIGYILI